MSKKWNNAFWILQCYCLGYIGPGYHAMAIWQAIHPCLSRGSLQLITSVPAFITPSSYSCCLLPVACCLLHVACCLLPAACCLLPAACCLLTAACCLLPAPCFMNEYATPVYKSIYGNEKKLRATGIVSRQLGKYTKSGPPSARDQREPTSVCVRVCNSPSRLPTVLARPD